MASTLADLQSLIHGLVPSHVEPTLAAVGLAESARGTQLAGDAVAPGSTPYQCRGYSSWGIWQIHLPAHAALLQHLTGSMDPCAWASWLSVPAHAAQAAAAVYHSSGLGAWTTYRTGAYHAYLSAPSVAPARLTWLQRVLKWATEYWAEQSQASVPGLHSGGLVGVPPATAATPAHHYGIPEGSVLPKLGWSVVGVGLILIGALLAGLGAVKTAKEAETSVTD